MEARWLARLVVAVAIACVAATHRSPNFTVHAPTAAIARQVSEHAEHYRRELAREWLGRELPRWSRPCQVTVQVGNLGAGGATTFSFDQGEVFGWKMNVQGTLERILVSVLPHEISHTIFACHFRRPLPRWADEGAATLAEDQKEQQRQAQLLRQCLASKRYLPLRSLLGMTEYPHDVLALYAQGYSLARFLVELRGRETYLDYLADAHQAGWDRALQKHYRYSNVEQLEKHWLAWVRQGSPDVTPSEPEQAPSTRLAVARRPQPNIIFRAQAPDIEDEPSPASKADDDVALQSDSPPATVETADPFRTWTPEGSSQARPQRDPSASASLRANRGESTPRTVSGPLRARRGSRATGRDGRPATRRPSAAPPVRRPTSSAPRARQVSAVSRGGSVVIQRNVPYGMVRSAPAIGPAYHAQPLSFAPT